MHPLSPEIAVLDALILQARALRRSVDPKIAQHAVPWEILFEAKKKKLARKEPAREAVTK